MKNLVVYYTLSGNTEIIAQEISRLVKGDLKKIESVKRPSFVQAAFSALIGSKGKIEPLDFSVDDYDNIFLGSQVWAGKSNPFINTFLSEANFENKNIFIFLTQSDSKEPVSVFDSIADRIGKKGGSVVDRLFIQTKMKNIISRKEVIGPVTDWLIKNKLIEK